MKRKTNRPKVSVLMPAYNAEKYISESIESILNQTFKDFEFIIVDDASTDNTLAIIKSYAQKDNRIKVLTNKKNLGIAGSRNRLIREARGEYVVWQDADDISVTTRIKEQVYFMDKHKNVGICGGYLELFGVNGITGIRKYNAKDKQLRKTIFRYSPVAQPTAIIRKSILNKVGEYDLEMPPAEDLDMSFRIGKLSEFANIEKVLLRYREHETSATFSKLKTIEINTFKTRLKAIKLGYKPTFIDVIYNIGQFITLWIMPPKFRISLFNLIRNTK